MSAVDGSDRSIGRQPPLPSKWLMPQQLRWRRRRDAPVEATLQQQTPVLPHVVGVEREKIREGEDNRQKCGGEGKENEEEGEGAGLWMLWLRMFWLDLRPLLSDPRSDLGGNDVRRSRVREADRKMIIDWGAPVTGVEGAEAEEATSPWRKRSTSSRVTA